MRPACSTTNSRFEPSPAWVRNTGLSKARFGKAGSTLIRPIGSIGTAVWVAGGGVALGLLVAVIVGVESVSVTVGDGWAGVFVAIALVGDPLRITGFGVRVGVRVATGG